MARNLTAKHKICRTHGMKLCDSFKCPVVKRNYRPGQHGQKRMRGKLSDYGRQLREKQKAKYIYGLLERQFRNTFMRAQKLPGSAGTNLLGLLERRLDNVIFKAGFASTKRLARQLVTHGHLYLNGRSHNIPSYTVHVGDIISIHPNKAESPFWTETIERAKKANTPAWLVADLTKMTITIVAEPKVEELPQNIETHLIVEYYSR